MRARGPKGPSIAVTGLLVLLLPGVAVGLVSAADPPVCAPGQPSVVLDGTVGPQQAKTYRLLPVQVAAGTTRVEVAYDWADQDPLLAQVPESGTVVDLGLWDADGTTGADAFRGWGGSRQGVISRGMPPVWVQADSADRGFTPGPVEPGTWHVELGFGNVNPGGGSWHVEVTCRDAAVGSQPIPAPVDPGHVADPDPGWYHGDFHMHGYHSHPQGPTHEEVVAHAREVGLDFLPITEYVTTVHHDTWGPVAAANPDLVVWPGREVITYHGHANVLGETPGVVDYRHGHGDVTIGDIQARSVAAGALFQVNHPTIFPDPLLGSFCRGCEFNLFDQVDLDHVDTIEVLTGEVEVDASYLGGPPGPGIEQPFVQSAIDVYEDLLIAGHFVAPVSGSDAKQVDGHGSSATAVYADRLSRPALVDGIRRGRTYVRTRGVDASPSIEITATDGIDTVMLGGTLHADAATLDIRVVGGVGQVVEVSRNGLPLVALPVLSDDDTLSVPISRGPFEGPLGTFHRVDVRELSGIRSVISSAIFLADAPPPDPDPGKPTDPPPPTDPPSPTDPTSPGEPAAPPSPTTPPLPATGGGVAAVVALLAVAARRRR